MWADVGREPQALFKYVKYTKKGVPVLCMELYKALYGLMCSVLLFYHKLKSKLTAYGFKLNPYAACVSNKIKKDGKQLIVLWQVDDINTSCVHSHEITKSFPYTKRLYGNWITINRSNKFEFLGMPLDYLEAEVLSVNMTAYINNIISDWPEVISQGR